eukprot:TRINITY_DN437_c0_g4_i1.p1 TRINITY_DN437_c0_g4~~TRINITY_DN437_c0_g4_i1.p1  ORF type:complete len:352 (-),score=70.46 TRINITY_DN437_c0_g4_i1:54-1109(-)
MGGCSGKLGTKEQQLIDRNINKKIKKRLDTTEVKLLFLGAGDSGKSTFCKQLRSYHHNGFPARERKKYIYILRLNALSNMQIICHEIEENDYDISEKHLGKVERILNCHDTDSRFFQIGEMIHYLYENEPLVKTILKNKSSELSLSKMSKFYFNNVLRFSRNDFYPDHDDIIRAKIKTSGIITTEFSVEGIKFILMDVGGQRSERRKWISCFDDVTTVVFLAALDGYDLVLYEDSSVNRLEESLELFKGLTRDETFQGIPFLLFLNKVDLFEKIYIKHPLHRAFKGEISKSDAKDFEYCKRFIANKFESLCRNSVQVYTHFTCALDQDNCQRVFNDCRDVMMDNELEAAGF